MINWLITNTEREIETGKVLKASVLIIAQLEDFKQQKYLDIILDEPKSVKKIIKYEDLTQDDILGWVKEKLGEAEIDKIEEKLVNFVEAKKYEAEAKTTENGLP